MRRFTENNKQALLEAIRSSPTISEACQKVDISMNTFNHWMAKAKSGIPQYTDFRRRVEEAKNDNEEIRDSSWNRKLKYTVTYKGHTGSLVSLAKKHKLRYNVIYYRYLKHLANPHTFPLTEVFRPARSPQDSMNQEELERNIAKNLASIAESLERIANFCDKE